MSIQISLRNPGDTRFLQHSLRLAMAAGILTAGILPSKAVAQSYIPPVVTTATTTLYTSGSTSISPGQVAVDKAGNVYFVNHTGSDTLYEIPAASPTITNTAPIALITGIGQYNSNGAFVDPKGNLWIANGNGAPTVAGSSDYIGLVEVPAGANGIPDTSSLNSTSIVTVAATNCTATTTVPCVWPSNTYAVNITGYYSQPSSLVVDGSGNVYIDDYNSGSIISFNIANPNTGTKFAATPTANNAATLALDGAGNLYYCDSSSGEYGAGGTGKVSLVSGGALTTVGTTATITSALISSCTGVAADSYGNLYIIGNNANSSLQISEVPFENGALNFADEFGIVNGLTNSSVFGGSPDSNGNFYYSSYTNVMQVQINGYNFGNVAVGSTASASSNPPAPSLNLYTNVQQTGVSSYFPTGSPTTNPTAAYLQSFPYSGTKSFTGGSTFSVGSNYTITMNFQPIHPGLLKGSFTPRTNGIDDTIVNLQGNGVGPEPLFFPGTPSQTFTAAAVSTSNGAATKTLSAPQGIALDSYGDIFVADTGNGKVVADCLPTTTQNEDGTGGSTSNTFCSVAGYSGNIVELGTGFTSPVGIALDGAMGLYVLDSAAAATPVTYINGQTLTSSTLATTSTTFGGTALKNPSGIAVDGYSNIYITDTGNNRIVGLHQYGAAAAQPIVVVPAATTFGSTALNGPTGIAVDQNKNLFIADTQNNRIVEYSSTGVASVVTTGSVTLSKPYAITVYPSGNLVVADAAAVYLINGSSSTALNFGSSYATAGAEGVAIGPFGNIFLSNTSGDQVLQLNVSAPQTVTFPSTAAGSQSPSDTELVTNEGTASLINTAATINGDFIFDTTNTCSATATVTAGASCNLVTRYAPGSGAAGPETGSIVFTNNALSYSLNTTTSNETATFGTSGTQTTNLSGTATSSKTAQSITFTPPASPITYGQVISETLSATSTSGLAVTFSVLSGPGTIATGSNTLNITGVGSIVVAADQSGNSTYAAAQEVTQTVVVNPIPQTITFTSLGTSIAYTTTPITLSATGGASGNPVTFKVISGPGTISGNQLTLAGVGALTIAADQAGNSNYAAATEVQQSVNVTQAPQTINFATLSPSVIYSVGTLTLTATGGASGNPVTFSVISGPGSISNSTLTINGLGTIVVAADQAGNTDYTAAPEVKQTVVVNPIATVATPVLSLSTGTYAGAQALTITDSTPGAVIYYTTNGSTPTTSSTVYSSQSAPTVSVSETVEAIAAVPGYTNSSVATANVTITSSSPSFTYTMSATSLTLAPGASGTIDFTVTPSNGLNTTLTFGCLGLPAGASCAFNPPTVTTLPSQAPVNVVLTVTAPAATASLHPIFHPFFPETTLALAICFLGLRKRRRLQIVLLLLIGFAGFGMLSGCGSSAAHTDTSNVTVYISGGNVRESTTFTLTVQ
jgi:sugar lactone lactonase YvrE